MTKTSLEVTSEALRTLGVLAEDEAASADQYQRAKAHLDGIFATLDETYSLAPEWTVETVPDRLFLPLSQMVAGSLATGYALDQYVPLYRVGLAGVMRDERTGQPRRPTEAAYY